MKSNWYQIDNFDLFVQSARVLVFNSFAKEKKDFEDSIETNLDSLTSEQKIELDSILSQSESILIAKAIVKTKIDDATQSRIYLISDKRFMQLLEDLNTRMVSNLLHSLVKRGLLETAYDEEQDDFVFWTTPNNEDLNDEKNQKS
jgi:hypothetical protein